MCSLSTCNQSAEPFTSDGFVPWKDSHLHCVAKADGWCLCCSLEQLQKCKPRYLLQVSGLLFTLYPPPLNYLFWGALLRLNNFELCKFLGLSGGAFHDKYRTYLHTRVLINNIDEYNLRKGNFRAPNLGEQRAIIPMPRWKHSNQCHNHRHELSIDKEQRQSQGTPKERKAQSFHPPQPRGGERSLMA